VAVFDGDRLAAPANKAPPKASDNNNFEIMKLLLKKMNERNTSRVVITSNDPGAMQNTVGKLHTIHRSSIVASLAT
jgi:hypothetical protein